MHLNFFKKLPKNVQMLFVCAFFHLLLVLESYGTRNESQKITGGFDTVIEDHPYQLSVRRDGLHFCGASLITLNVALSAAHCFVNSMENVYYTISAGNTEYDSSRNLRLVTQVSIHPKFDPTIIDYDVAVLKLNKPYVLTLQVQLAELQSVGSPELEKGDLGVVTGWGTTRGSTQTPPDVLQKASIPYVPRRKCIALYQDTPDPTNITDRMLCFGYTQKIEGIDSCQGDSGGPMFFEDKQVGIVSWGYGCGDSHFPGVYTNIAHPEIYSFIVKTVQKYLNIPLKIFVFKQSF